MLFIGVDLGTSAVKLLLVNEKGEILNTVSKEYPLDFPHPGWSEQKPEDWMKACMEGIPELLENRDAGEVAGLSVAGQMHGLVILDEADRVIRPAILWNDGRTFAEVDYLNNTIGKDKLSEWTGNIAFAGFTAPKILWVQKNEPENFAKIKKIMLPKDYINYCLTGVHSCDYSDASGMLLLDVEHKKWSAEMMEICNVSEDQMPGLYESYDVIGTIKPEIAEKLGLPAGVKVTAGAGDNAAAAVGTGTVGQGACNISLGTSGTIFISSEKFGVDSLNSLHSFAHADGKFHLMGCMLSAASCNKWFCEDILGTEDFAAEQAKISEDAYGKNNVFFLPYLMGERSPINDTDASGTFIGLRMDTTRADMVLAVLEGVSFAIRDSFEVAKKIGVNVPRSRICGGGSKSPLWRKMLAAVLGIPLEILQTEQGPGYGAAILAMVGVGVFPDVKTACDELVHVAEVEEPDPELTARYQERYEKFSKIYPACKQLFKELV
ncbi:MAG: xylulokinase [Flexilinea sp.]|nr:xylulokinase [Flexilinea sp.]